LPLVVELLLGDVGFVSVVLELLLELLLEVGGVVAVAVDVTVSVVVGVELLLDELVVVLWQSRAASCPTVAAPWPRFCTRVVLILGGRLATWLENARAAPVAASHLPAATAEDTESSWALRLLA
jgi:hypothetical protein